MRHLVFLLLFLISQIISAQVYKWVDEDGITQYTDQPPPSAVQIEKKLTIKVTPTPETIRNSNLDDEMEGFNKRREEKLEERSKKAAQAEEYKMKCANAQGRLRMYRDSPRLTIPDGKGGILYVDDDARQIEINKLNEAIAKFCE